MSDQTTQHTLDRRTFMKTSAAVAGAAVITTASGKVVRAEVVDHRNYQPDKMGYARLGRTNFMCSRLTFGCGAALMGGKATRLLDRAF